MGVIKCNLMGSHLSCKHIELPHAAPIVLFHPKYKCISVSMFHHPCQETFTIVNQPQTKPPQEGEPFQFMSLPSTV